MNRSTHHPLSLALRGLLVALWAVSTLFAPAHAAMDALEDPCQQAVAVDSGSDDVATSDTQDDLDQKFHALHDCGTCHVHVLLAGAGPAVKPTLEPAPRIFATIEAASISRVGGPFRPPRA